METINNNRVLPYRAIHPGHHIKRELAFREMTQKALADTIGVKASNLSAVINGKRPINQDLAIALSKVFTEYTPEMWLSMQSRYDLQSKATEQGFAGSESRLCTFKAPCEVTTDTDIINLTFEVPLYLYQEQGRTMLYAPSFDISTSADDINTAMADFYTKFKILMDPHLVSGDLISQLKQLGWKRKGETLHQPSIKEMIKSRNRLKDIVLSGRPYTQTSALVSLRQ